MGTWIQTDAYGYVWQPTINDPDWAPYTEGHWVYSDAGWTWASDESFGWATYHYGRWVNLNGIGWCWVPGYTWAPAWVSWRYGDGYCGWAPLPPDSFVGIDYGGDGIDINEGFHIGGDCDSYYDIGAGCYTFVPVIYLGYPNYRGRFINRYNNYAIINHTTNVTNLYVARNGAPNGSGHGRFSNVTAGGPSFAQVNAVSKMPVQKVTITSARQPGGGTLNNNSLALFAPRLNAGATSQPARVGSTLGQTTVNRGVDVTQPLAVNHNLAAAPPTSNQIQQAQLAQFNAPPHAKVVTTATPSTPVLQAPLTTLKPIAATAPPQPQSVTPSTQTVTHNPSGGNYSQTRVYTPSSTTQYYNPFVHPSSTTTSNGTVVHTQAQSTPQTQSSPAPANNRNAAPASPQPSSQPQYAPATSGDNPNTAGNQNGGGYPGGGYHNSSGGNGSNSWGNRGGNQQQNH